MTDTFKGDNAKLIECIRALISLSDDGALVPHGLGGHARTLLDSAATRLESLLPASTDSIAEQFVSNVCREYVGLPIQPAPSQDAQAVAWQMRSIDPADCDYNEWKSCSRLSDDSKQALGFRYEFRDLYAHPAAIGAGGVSEGSLVGQAPNPLATEAACFRWLCEDIADAEERQRRNSLLARMGTMSYSAVCQQIDYEWGLVAEKKNREATQAALKQENAK